MSDLEKWAAQYRRMTPAEQAAGWKLLLLEKEAPPYQFFLTILAHCEMVRNGLSCDFLALMRETMPQVGVMAKAAAAMDKRLSRKTSESKRVDAEIARLKKLRWTDERIASEVGLTVDAVRSRRGRAKRRRA
jgi:hypothetical protein